MRVLLIYPRFHYIHAGGLQEPLGVLYIASALSKAGHSVSLLDLTFQEDFRELDKHLDRCNLIGFSVTTALFDMSVTILQRIKSIHPGALCIIGGPHATVMPEQCLDKGFDICILGEGEKTVVELVNTLESGLSLSNVPGIVWKSRGGIEWNPPQYLVEDIDTLSLPSRRLIDYSTYFTRGLSSIGIIASRGCPYQCLFCKPMQDKLFGKKFRRRSAQNVVHEIEWTLSSINPPTRLFFFKDDTFSLLGTSWFEEFREELERRSLDVYWFCQSRVDTVNETLLKAMHQAGCRRIGFGVESGSQRILDYYRKGIQVSQVRQAFELCHQIGIEPTAYIMLGAPDETKEDIRKTMEVLLEIRPYGVSVAITTPAPGTDLYKIACQQNLLNVEKSKDFDYYQTTLPMKLQNLSLNDLIKYKRIIEEIPVLLRRKITRERMNNGTEQRFHTPQI